jgi:NAD+ synthase
MIDESSLKIDAVRVTEVLSAFLRKQVERLGRDGAVVGLSGGIDSSVSAALAVHALGPERVLGLVMPERDSHPDSRRGIRAERVRRWFDARRKAHGVSSFAETLVSLRNCDIRDDVARQRCKPRTRMLLLYAAAERHNYLVLGTTNRSEFLVGFFTKYGDGAADVEPLVPLYKTQVRQLGRRLGIPERILDKPPSSDVVPGITDEQRLNLPYAVLDRILYGREKGLSDEQVAEAVGVGIETVHYVAGLRRDSAYRRDPPAIPSIRTAGS